VNISPVDPDLIDLQRILKNVKITASKTYSLPGIMLGRLH